MTSQMPSIIAFLINWFPMLLLTAVWIFAVRRYTARQNYRGRVSKEQHESLRQMRWQLPVVLYEAWRSSFLLRPRPDAFDVGLITLVGLVVVSVIIEAASQYALIGPEASFDPYGIGASIANTALMLGYFAIVPFNRAGLSPTRLLTSIVAMGSWLTFVEGFCGQLIRLSTPEHLQVGPTVGVSLSVLRYVIIVWACSAVFRLVTGMAAQRRLLAGLSAVVVTLVAAVTLPTPPIFYGDVFPRDISLLTITTDFIQRNRQHTAAAGGTTTPHIDYETTLYRQPELVGTSLARIEPPPAEKPALYFVGFAPYASQAVFKREVMAVKSLFDERFGTSGRSLLLINHRDTLGSIPLANGSNLETVLKRIGELMRPDKDVLFLFITSHGSPGDLAVSFSGFPFNNLTPARLKATLDRAGVRLRVLLISACYSGSFIPALRDDNSIIIASAREDRTSFGCSDENEWTHFGDAYFNHALRSEISFIRAFDEAKNLIEQWERRDRLDSSDPQMHVGEAIRARIGEVIFPSGVQ